MLCFACLKLALKLTWSVGRRAEVAAGWLRRAVKGRVDTYLGGQSSSTCSCLIWKRRVVGVAERRAELSCCTETEELLGRELYGGIRE